MVERSIFASENQAVSVPMMRTYGRPDEKPKISIEAVLRFERISLQGGSDRLRLATGEAAASVIRESLTISPSHSSQSYGGICNKSLTATPEWTVNCQDSTSRLN